MNGATFTQLASKYNLSLDDLYNVDDEKTKIDSYKQAYESTGTSALKAMMNGGMMASDMAPAAEHGAGPRAHARRPPAGERRAPSPSG